MKIAFQKTAGSPSTPFYWRLQVDGLPATTIEDLFIPELFFDFLAVRQGELIIQSGSERMQITAGQQCLKALFTQSIHLQYTLPLDLFGGRFPLSFAETYAGELPGQSILSVDWLPVWPDTLAEFADLLAAAGSAKQSANVKGPLLQPNGEFTPRLACFSPRHQRRLLKKTYGISHKEMIAIQNLHAFLGRTCDFSTPHPRIIEYLDSDVFYDQPHLNRTFKKMTGLSPLEYFESRSILQENLMAASYNAFGR